MTTLKKVSVICSVVLIITIGGFGIYEWITKEIINVSTTLFVFIGIGFFFQSITWGELYGKQEGKKNGIEKQITFVSAKISYYVLLVLMLIVLVVSERVIEMNEIKNMPLVIVIGVAWITMPITEFIVSRKYHQVGKER